MEGIKVLGHAELRGEVVDDISATYTLHTTIEALSAHRMSMIQLSGQ